MSAAVLIAVDWGSSAVRALLLDARAQVLSVLRSADGVLTRPPADYAAALAALLQPWLAMQPGLPVLLAGMVGSRSGWHEVGYVDCPATPRLLSANLFAAADLRGHAVRIVPGVAGTTPAGEVDLMRGEEVQLAGLLALTQAGDEIVVLPGTHTKWARLRNGEIGCFATGIAGELYALFGRHSCLAALVDLDGAWDPREFGRGLDQGRRGGGLSHQLFSLRAQCLRNGLAAAAAAQRLSGLVLGHEARAMHALFGQPPRVTLIGSAALAEPWQHALAGLECSARWIDGEAMFALGALAIARQAGLLAEGAGE